MFIHPYKKLNAQTNRYWMFESFLSYQIAAFLFYQSPEDEGDYREHFREKIINEKKWR